MVDAVKVRTDEVVKLLGGKRSNNNKLVSGIYPYTYNDWPSSFATRTVSNFY